MSLKQNTNLKQAYPSTVYLSGSGCIGETQYNGPVTVYNVPNVASSFYSFGTTNSSTLSSNRAMANISLDKGLWLVSGMAEISNTGPTKYQVGLCPTSSTSASGYASNISGLPSYEMSFAPVGQVVRKSTVPMIYSLNSPTSFYIGVMINEPVATNYVVSSWIQGIRLA